MTDRQMKAQGEGENDRQRRRIYNKRQNRYFQVNANYRTRWTEYQGARKDFKDLRVALMNDQKKYEQEQDDKTSFGDWFQWAWEEPFVKGMAVLAIPALVLIYANLEIVKAESLPIIALPSLFLAPLWVAGLDRLHKYYSELQARIAGNILRQQQTSIQRLVDVVTNSESRNDLIKNLDTAISEKSTLANFLQGSGAKQTTATAASAAGQDARTLGLEPLSMNPDDDDTALDLGTISGDGG